MPPCANYYPPASPAAPRSFGGGGGAGIPAVGGAGSPAAGGGGGIIGPFADPSCGGAATEQLSLAKMNELQRATVLIVASAAGSVKSVNGLIAIMLLVRVVMLAVNVVMWSVLQRVLSNLHDRGPSREQLRAIAIVLIGLSIAPTPINYLAEALKLPKPVAHTEPAASPAKKH